MENNNNGRPLGVHVSVLQSLFRQTPNGCSAEYVFTAIVKPATLEAQQAYIDFLVANPSLVSPNAQTAEGKPLVGPATCYVSHTWSSTFAAVLDCVQQFDERYPDTYFWIDLLCTNHHAAATAELPPEWWTTTLRQRMRDIGHVLFVVSPLTSPLLLTRAWCLFELLTAICMKLPFSFVVAAAEREHFKQEILQGDPRPALSLLAVIAQLDCRQAGARMHGHAQGMGQAVGSLAGGFGTFTQTIKNTLHRWAVQVIVDVAMDTEAAAAVESIEGLAHALAHVAGERAGAVVLLERCLTLRTAHEDGERSLEVAKLHLLLGQLLNGADQLDRAAAHVMSAIAVQQAVLGETHKDLAWSHLVLVDLYEKKKEGGDELVVTHATKALTFLRGSLGEYNPTTAGALAALGNAHLRLGDTKRAQQAFESELAIRKAIDVPNYSNLARVHEHKRDFAAALRLYQKDLTVKLETYGDACVLTQVAYLNLSHAYKLNHNDVKAQECLDQSKAIQAAGAVSPLEARAATARRRVFRLTCLVALWCLIPAVLARGR
eukprot:m.5496 g.5496  ORF g.5496 m.5496 type:complete len:546 (+) comp4542_c0_seq2:292-1929(+)